MYQSSNLISMEYLRKSRTHTFYAFIYFLRTYNEILENKACLSSLNLIAYSQKRGILGRMMVRHSLRGCRNEEGSKLYSMFTCFDF